MRFVPFGSTGKRVSAIGLGGEGVLRTFDRKTEAQAVIREAIDKGITYFDSARVYSDSEVYLGSIWKEDPALRCKVFQTSKSASRTKDEALADLMSSLERLHTDYLDLWQIHDVRTDEDIEAISGPGGALEAFVEARKKGIVRYVGVTGHHDPYILTRAVNEWPVDSVMMPVNPIEGLLGGFLTHTLPVARENNIAVIGMKVLGAGHYILSKQEVTAELLIRYSKSYDITVPIIGCASPEEVQGIVSAQEKPPLSVLEKKKIEDQFRSNTIRFAFYRGVF
jgi:aryl-alcohol dehydrogenase-like predicted oxidoreductase